MASTNGKPPTDLARKLTRKDYAQDVSSALGQQRIITRSLLQQSLGQFDPEFIDLPRLYQMRRDPMIQMGLHYVKAPILRSKWHVDCQDARIAAAVDETLRRVQGPLIRTALNMLDFGFQGAIKVFKLGQLDSEYQDSEGNARPVWPSDQVQPVVLAPPIPLPPEFCTVALKDGEFRGISASFSQRQDSEEDPTVPAEHALWWTNEFEETFRNYYGFPRTGYAYRYWWSYWFRFHMEDRHFEQDADPALQVWYPPGTHVDGDGNEQPNRTAALQLGEDLRGGATVAIPSDVHIDEQGKATTTPLWKAEFLKGGENLQAFRQSSEYLDVMKLRSILVPEQALVEGKGGTSSRNVAATYGEIFNESLGQLASDLDDMLNDYVIPQLVEANFGAGAPRARKVTTGFQEEDLSLTTELIKLAFQLDPNALPVNFEKMLEQVDLPMYTRREQEERQAEVAAQQAAQQAPPEQAPPEQAPPEQAPPEQLAASYRQQREVIHLHQHAKPVASKLPAWARREYERRDRNTGSIAEAMEEVMRDRYAAVFAAAADALHQDADGLDLGIRDAVTGIIDRIKAMFKRRLEPHDVRVRGELASLYHASGAAELQRLGLDTESWDVGRDEVQEWARRHAGELITTMDQTVIEQHLRPWLTRELGQGRYGVQEDGVVPDDADELALRLSEHFEGYPEWMARRVVRTEARMGYNQSAADIWERVGVKEVVMIDGRGGVSGITDEVCLARNGEQVTIDEFREEDRREHPNGTLTAVPVTVGLTLTPVTPGAILADAVRSRNIYAVTDGGLILSQAEVGALLAGD